MTDVLAKAELCFRLLWTTSANHCGGF